MSLGCPQNSLGLEIDRVRNEVTRGCNLIFGCIAIPKEPCIDCLQILCSYAPSISSELICVWDMLVRNWNLDWTCKNILFWNFQSFNNLLHSSNYQSCYTLMSDILNFGCYFFLKDQKLGQQVSDYFSVVQGLYCNKQRTNPQKYSQSWLSLIFSQ